MFISVLMPLYNSEKYIGDAIESVLCQTHKDFELLVIDDGSTDNSNKIVSQFKDSRIKLYCRTHSGLIDGLNYGLSVAQGQAIARFDNDDICLNDRLENQIGFLNNHPEIGVVAGGACIIDENGRMKNNVNMPEKHDDIAYGLESFFNPVIHPAVMIRKDILVSIGGYRDNFQAAEDYDLWLRLLRTGVRFENLPYPVIKLRKHDKNMSMVQLENSTRSCFLALLEHFFWKHNGFEAASLGGDQYKNFMIQALDMVQDTGLIEAWCWRAAIKDNLKTDHLKTIFNICRSLFDKNKRHIILNRSKKIISTMETMAKHIEFDRKL